MPRISDLVRSMVDMWLWYREGVEAQKAFASDVEKLMREME